MRNLSLRVIAAALAIAVTLPVLAQFPGGGGRGMFNDPAMLLMNKSVQEELKLTDEQKAELAKVSEKRDEMMKKAFEGGKGKGGEAMKTVMEDVKKEADKVREKLTSPQAKRLKQISLQQGGMRSLAEDDVQASLKMTDKQKDEIKSIVDEAGKDAAELFKEAQGDRSKMKETRKKVEAINKEAFDKVTTLLTDEQKKSWEEMVGPKFEVKFDFGGGFGGKGKGKNKDN